MPARASVDQPTHPTRANPVRLTVSFDLTATGLSPPPDRGDRARPQRPYYQRWVAALQALTADLSDDRNALGQDASAAANQRIVIRGDSPGTTPSFAARRAGGGTGRARVAGGGRAVGAAPPDMLSNRLCPPRPPGSVDRSAQPSVRALGVWIGFPTGQPDQPGWALPGVAATSVISSGSARRSGRSYSSPSPPGGTET